MADEGNRPRLGGVDAVLRFLMPARAVQWRGGHTPTVAEAEAKRGVGTNSEEVK